MKEIWKEIPGFPDYQVSDQGRVRSMKRSSPHILKPSHTKAGCSIVSMSQYHESYCKQVHTLVAQVFVPKPIGNCYVQHINGNLSDNRACNLVWSLRNHCGESRKVYAYDQDWHHVFTFSSASEASMTLGGSAGSIRNVCCGIGNTYLGYHWSYSSPDELEDNEYDRDNADGSRAVYQYEGDPGNETWVHTWDNFMVAGEATGIDPDSILRCCRGAQKRAGGYAWDFADKYLQIDEDE